MMSKQPGEGVRWGGQSFPFIYSDCLCESGCWFVACLNLLIEFVSDFVTVAAWLRGTAWHSVVEVKKQ